MSKKTALRKDILREIKTSFPRFLSILALSGLGVFVLVGLTTTGPMMRESMEVYLQEANHQDMTISLGQGLDEDDQSLINTIDTRREYGHRINLIEEKTFKGIEVTSLPEKMGLPLLKEGWLPVREDEILLDEGLQSDYKMGDEINFNPETNKFDPEAEDKLTNYRYRVVGFAESIDYLYLHNKGTDDNGGTIDNFAYVRGENFRGDPNFVKLQYKDVAGLPVSSKEYQDKMDAHRDEVKTLFKDRPDIRLTEQKEDIKDSIQEGKEEIAKAKDEIEKARQQLQDAKAKLESGRKQLADGEAAYSRGIREGEAKLAASEAKLAAGRQALEANRKKLEAGRKEIDQGHFLLRKNQSDYKRGLAAYRAGLDGYNLAMSLVDEKLKLVDKFEAGLEGPNVQPEKSKLGLLSKKSPGDDLATEGRPPEQNRSQAIKIQEDLDQVRASIEKDRQELEALKQNRASLEEKLAQPMDANLRDRRDQLEARLQEINPRIADREAMNQRLQAQIDALKLDPESGSEFINEKLANLQAINLEFENLRREAQDLRAQLSQLDGILRTEGSESRATLQKQYEDLNLNIGKLEDDIAFKEGKLSENTGSVEYRKPPVTPAPPETAREESQPEEPLDTLQSSYQELKDQQKLLLDGKRELSIVRALLKAEKAGLLLSKEELDKVGAQLEEAEAQLREAEKKLANSEAALNRGMEEMRQGEAEIALGERQVQEGRRQLDQERIRGRKKLDAARADLAQGEAAYRQGQSEFDEKSAQVDEEIAKGEEDIAKAEDMLDIIQRPSYTILPIHKEFNTHMHIENSKNIDNLAMIFPIFFFAIAMLLSSTAMNRMVEEERGQIGTYKALGYSNGDIAKKYLIYGMVAAFVGGIIGALVGNYFLSPLISESYSTGYIFDQDLTIHFYPVQTAVSIIIGLVATGLVAYLTLKRSLKLNAAQLMRPKAPAKGNRIFLERITPLWKRLSFLQKVTARNIFRYKKRMLMTVIGVLGCTALLVLGFGIGTSIKGLGDKQFKDLTRFDSLVFYEEKLDREAYAQYRAEIDSDSDIGSLLSAHINTITVPNESGQDQEVILITPEEPGRLDEIITLRDRRTGEAVKLDSGDVVITEKLADLYDIKPGGYLEFMDESDQRHIVNVTGITEGYAGHYMYMTPDTYEDYFKEAYRNNGGMVRFKSSLKESPLEDYLDNKSVLAVRNLSEDQVYMEALTSNMQLIVMVIVMASTLLALVVLFNLTEINIAERKRELSTIIVLGFYPKEVTTYIYRETGLLTMIGIFIGLFVGKLLHYVVMRMVVPDHAMLDPRLKAMNFIIPAAITLVISLLVMLVVHRRLQHIDMVEALKGVE